MKPLDLTTFSKVSLQEWHEEAQNQLKGKDPFAEFNWSSLGLENLKPYYDEASIEGLSDQIAFFHQLPSHEWKLYDKIEVENESDANKIALAALIGGCDGIIFESQQLLNSEKLLSGIDMTICDISIKQQVEGASGMNGINTLTVTNSLDSVNQVSAILGSLSDSHQWVCRDAFADFFLEIATVRALRFLLNTRKSASQVKIHSCVPCHAVDEYQWFLNSTTGLASILGGSYSVNFETATGDPRISRNVGNIIREESGIDTYEDQCGGSYYVESLTHRIIDQVQNN